MNKVTLEQAYYWQCPGCRHKNYEELTIESPTEEESLQLQKNGLLPWGDQEDEEFVETVQFVLMPEEVLCRGCGKTYETQARDMLNADEALNDDDSVA